jgi:hypothetical protein
MARYRRRHDQVISQTIKQALSDYIPRFEIYNEGKWVTAENLPKEAAKAMKKGYDSAIGYYAKSILRIVKNSLMKGKPPRGTYWPPMTEAYEQRWESIYPGHHLMNLTGQYLRSVGMYTRGKKTYIGVVSGEKRTGPYESEDNLTMNQVAIIQEFGNAKGTIPARPLWAPAVRQYNGGDKNRLGRDILFQIRNKLIYAGIDFRQVK